MLLVVQICDSCFLSQTDIKKEEKRKIYIYIRDVPEIFCGGRVACNNCS